MKLMRSSVDGVLDFRLSRSRWPWEAPYANTLDHVQRKMIAHVLEDPWHPDDDEQTVALRKGR